MYGMVNRALEDYLRLNHGDDTWSGIVRHAGVDVDMFVSSERYDDAVTYGLVGSASQVLGVSADSILEGFGRHWVLRTAREGYGDLIAAAGRTLPEFLGNLPNFHARVYLYFADLCPPTFRVADVGENSLRLHYLSHREGLAPFVRGLLLGLGEMFETDMDVLHEEKRGVDAEHDVFLVRWRKSGDA